MIMLLHGEMYLLDILVWMGKKYIANPKKIINGLFLFCNMGPITKSVQTGQFANLLYFDHHVKLTQVITCMVQ